MKCLACKLIVFLLAVTAVAQDSLKTVLWKPQLFLLRHSAADSLGIRLEHPEQPLTIPPTFLNWKNIVPSNPLLLDTRESSYYTPSVVQRELAHIMNRPTSNEVWPVGLVAMLAARLALQRLQIIKKTEIEAVDYLIPRRYWPILKALFRKSPQTVFQLYALKSINQDRTLSMLKNDLQFLIEQKLVKPRYTPEKPVLYFSAQSRTQALRLIEQGLRDDRVPLSQKKQWLDLKNYLTGEADGS